MEHYEQINYQSDLLQEISGSLLTKPAETFFDREELFSLQEY